MELFQAIVAMKILLVLICAILSSRRSQSACRGTGFIRDALTQTLGMILYDGWRLIWRCLFGIVRTIVRAITTIVTSLVRR